MAETPALSEQSASHGKCRQPYQPGETQAAEHGSGAKIFNTPDFAVLLASNMIGQFFDSSVEKFYSEHDEQRTNHGSIPGAVRSDHHAKQQPADDEKGFIAQRCLGLEAVDEAADRVLCCTVKTLQDGPDQSEGERLKGGLYVATLTMASACCEQNGQSL